MYLAKLDILNPSNNLSKGLNATMCETEWLNKDDDSCVSRTHVESNHARATPSQLRALVVRR